jgi:hypothetical protein
MDRESARAEESTTPPELSKGTFGDGVCATVVGAWGRWMAPRGLWFSLNESGVANRPETRRRATSATTTCGK